MKHIPIAFIISPLAAAATFSLLLPFLGVPVSFMLGYFISGAGFSYAAMLVLGVPTYFILKAFGKTSASYLVSAGGLIGVVLFSLIGSGKSDPLIFIVGFICGCIAGLTFHRISAKTPIAQQRKGRGPQ